MKSDKSRRARLQAEALFSGLKKTESSAVTRSQNPFGDGGYEQDEVDDQDEDIFRLVPFPRAIEVPPGYESVDHVREAMRRACRIEWHAFHTDTVDVSLPHDWGLHKPDGGAIEVISPCGTRAIFGRAAKAEIRLLSRYRLDSQEDPKDRHSRVVVRDYDRGGAVLESSYYASQSGPSHPEWNRLKAWLDKEFPLHRDPLRYWEDCEENIKTWDRLSRDR